MLPMPTLVGILLVWAATGAVDGGAPPDGAAPPTEPTALGASLHLPRPRLLPCERFQTVELEVGEDVEHLSYDEGASINWRAAGREWTFVAVPWTNPKTPLRAAALPTQVLFRTTTPHGAARLTFHCKRYDRTERGELMKEADPFKGVQWSCEATGCRSEAGYALPKAAATSSSRLRLCDKDPQRNWEEDFPSLRSCRDVAPTFGDREKALTLAAEILLDARKTLEDVCRHPGVCVANVRASIARALRPGRWRSTAWSALGDGMKLSASVDGRALVLDCSGTRQGDAHCDLDLHDPQGRLLLTYMPIDTLVGPAEAVMFLKRAFLGSVDSSFLLRATSGQRGDDDLPVTSLSVPLLSVH
jgi:hypothetical protein